MKPRLTDDPTTCNSPRGVLTALADADCRAILVAVAIQPRSVPEIVEACEIPTATAYRKVESLVDAGLIEERVTIRPEGKNVNTYALRVESITITIEGSDGIECDCAIDVDDEFAGRTPNDGVIIREGPVTTVDGD